MTKFIDPLEGVQISQKPLASESSAGAMESTSMNNDVFDKCPKCGDKMKPAKIANDEPVVWCSKCRTSSPLEA